MHTLFFKPQDLPFNLNSLKKYLRISRQSEIPGHLNELINNLCSKSIELAAPAAKYCILRIIKTEEESKHIFLENNIVFQGKGIYKLLKQSKYAAVYCLTIGKHLEETISQMQAENFYEAYVLDCIASTFINGLNELLHSEILLEAKNIEMMLTKRFSPGYAGWKLEEQKKLFGILNSEDIGIRLTHECYMIPAKSLSGVYGLYY